MARLVEITSKNILVLVLGGEPREVFEYVDGVRTSTARTAKDGRPLWRFEAAVEVDGQPIGACTVLTCTPQVVTGQPMGTRLGGADGIVKITPDGQYDVRVTVTVPTLVATKQQGSA